MRVVISLLIAFTASIAGDHTQVWSVDQAMTKLQNGNQRFVIGKPNVWDSGSARRETLTAGQTPYACVITCADSRVPPEQIFDSGLGELFVIRVAGNVTPVEVLASADYAVGHFGCPVVVVMGHTKCGAVSAALSDTDFPEPLNTLVNEIRPSVDACLSKGYTDDEIYDGAIKENARAGAASLISGSRSIEQAVAAGNCVVLSAVYDMGTGAVIWQSQTGAVAFNRPVATPAKHVAEAPAPKQPLDERSHKSVAKTEKSYTDDSSSDKTQSNRKLKHHY